MKITPERHGILSGIGNTPLVELTTLQPKGGARIFVKVESSNPTASYKDRMALTMIEGAEAKGLLPKGPDGQPSTVVEATAGSTGTSLAMVCAAKGHRFTACTSNVFAQEKLKSMTAFGASLDLSESPNGGIDKDLIGSMVSRAKQLGSQPGYYHVDQFNNMDALTGYKTIAEEVIEQLPKVLNQPGVKMAAYCGAMGTGGMMKGCGDAFREHWPAVKLVGVEPASSPVYSRGVEHAGSHNIEGISPGFIPPHVASMNLNDVLAIDEGEARVMARRLAKKEGIFAGTSSGLNVAAAVRIAEKLGPQEVVVTVICDSGIKYLNGGLFEESKL